MPNSVQAIAPLIGQILVESETRRKRGEITALHLCYNRPEAGAVYEPVSQQLLPLGDTFHRQRQSSIDAELFDVIAGYELLAKKTKDGRAAKPTPDKPCAPKWMRSRMAVLK